MVKRVTTLTGWKALAILLVFSLILAGCSQAAAQPPAQPTQAPAKAQAAATVEPTQASTATALPSPTATMLPTATLQPTATATPLPPTATPVPSLALTSDGFSVWCAPESYAGVLPKSPDAPKDANLLAENNKQLEVKIPAAYCVVTVKFNQAAPQGAKLFFDDAGNAFLKLPLAAVDGKADTTWATVTHTYVVNPPLWWVTYRLAVVNADGKELWTNSVKFAKPLPKTCIYGGLPDPVTLWCTKTDPYEIEPYPWTVYPYDHDRLKTETP